MIYFDNAATSFPKPEKVYNEVLRCMKSYAGNSGRSSHSMAVKAASKIMDTRVELSELFNIESPFNIIFTSNATEALNIGIKGILKKGDHVISTVIEHNSVLRPLSYLSKRGIEVTLLEVDDKGYIDTKILKKEIKQNTKAIIINHGSNVLGTIQDIKSIGRIAKEEGILFLVDASQSAGVISIDVIENNIDLLAFPGHKGLYGPQGTGAIYIKDGIQVEEYNQGGTGSNSLAMEQPEILPDRFESGTLNTPGIAGWCEGVKFIKKVGIDKIKEHESELVQCLLEELMKLPYVKIYGDTDYKNRCAVVSINLDNIDSSEVGNLLSEKGIAVRTGYHCAPLIHRVIGTHNMGTIRISPGYFNTFDDVENIIKSLIDIYERKTI